MACPGHDVLKLQFWCKNWLNRNRRPGPGALLRRGSGACPLKIFLSKKNRKGDTYDFD